MGLTKMTGNDSVRDRPRTETLWLGESHVRGDNPGGFLTQTFYRVDSGSLYGCRECHAQRDVSEESCLHDLQVTGRSVRKKRKKGYSPRAGLPSLRGSEGGGWNG